MVDRLSAEAWSHADGLRQTATGSAMLLLQFAAARAEIGHFARRGRATPQSAARCYEAAAQRARERKTQVA